MQMTMPAAGDWTAVRTLLRWRIRMIRNSIASDSGFLGVFLGGLLYLAIVVVMALQSRAGGTLTRQLAGIERQLALSLLGMHFFVVVCIQAGALYFFRISLEGDFRTARWRVLPVGRSTLRRAHLVDSLLNPGAVAALIATWILVFGFARPTEALSVIACVLVSPIFVSLSQSMFVFAADLLNRFRVAGTWLLFLMIGAAGILLTGYIVSLASGTTPAFIRNILLSDSVNIALRMPPWGLPLLVVQRLDAGGAQNGEVFGLLIAAAAAGFLLIVAANRIAAITELD